MWEKFIELAMQYGLFAAKAITVVLVIIFIVNGIAHAIQSLREQGTPSSDNLKIKNLNKILERKTDKLRAATMSESAWEAILEAREADQKAKAKTEAKAAKQHQKALKKDPNAKPNLPESKKRLFVLDFDGDVNASQVERLRDEVTRLVQFGDANSDTVLIRLESPGGVVHGYGLAATQLTRLRERGFALHIAVDLVAASGGYMMACVANHIYAAPFAVVGSIGVVAQVPNIHRLLKKNEIDVELHTAGEYKRTLTMLGENTDAGREKFRQELNETHDLFKAFIAQHRPQVNLDEVATGEHWYGKQALELKLIDEIATSDDVLLKFLPDYDIYHFTHVHKKSLSERLAEQMKVVLQTFGLFKTQNVNAPAPMVQTMRNFG